MLLLCCCYVVAMLLLCCCYAVAMLLLCCCYVTVLLKQVEFMTHVKTLQTLFLELLLNCNTKLYVMCLLIAIKVLYQYQLHLLSLVREFWKFK